MATARRYLTLTGVQLKASLMTAMQYRADFVLAGFMSVYWLFWNLVPVLILFDQRPSVAGWNFSAALVVIGWFTALRGLLEGAINPSLVDVVERIRTGAFDYVLLKPADTQFLVSTARFAPWKVLDLLGGVGIVIWALAMRGHMPSALQIGACMGLLMSSVLVLYSMWILIISACFWVVRLDNLTYLFTAIFDAARWPVQVFRGAWRIIFTLIVPLAIMTTYPAMALLGTLRLEVAILAVFASLVFALASRGVWVLAIRHYRSASS